MHGRRLVVSPLLGSTRPRPCLLDAAIVPRPALLLHAGAVRAHYGHPDLWNRHFSMTRGGVSKANASQHVSEDGKHARHAAAIASHDVS